MSGSGAAGRGGAGRGGAADRREELEERLRPDSTVLLTVECQEGVVGELSALPELAAVARRSGALANVARLVDAAHGAGVQVVHAVAERRPDGRGSSGNARLFRAAARLPVQQHSGSTAVRVAAPIQVADEDLVVRRLHGLSPLAGTDVDALLRNLGCRTLVVTGVSANVAVPNAVFDAVNLGYTVVVPRDAIAGVPADYTPAMIRNTLALVATLATTDDLLAAWKAPRRSPAREG
ncbi:cysteine hydrolase [Streptomyces sp. NPDC012421]|uniref:cysteine hydrolase n=1 Tax=Streptomyces sp. NPDC012421 TaxID=3364832 RepID=UPI0036EEF4EF